jgi:microcystin-dependent protein
MPRNSQGLYTLPAGNPVIPNTLIESNWANPTMDDIAAALTGSLPRDGSAPMTGLLTLSADAPTQSRHAISKGYLEQFLAYATGMPIGSVVAYAGASIPTGFFECNGQTVSRTTYADLFATIGTIYGAGNGVDTFNVPDMRDEFIRGKSAARAVGSKQAGSFASHTHTYSDPKHSHGVWQDGHSHGIWTNAHSHGVSENPHSHNQPVGLTFGAYSHYDNGGSFLETTNVSTGGATTGISIQSAGNLGGGTDTHQPTVYMDSVATGITIGGTGGTETVPQNTAQIYIIKAVNDASGPVAMTGITTSDDNMISVDETNPVVPELVIHSNVAFGTVKLDASGKVPLSQMSVSSSSFLGYFNASSGALPVGTFNSGDYYAVSVQGTLTVYDPVTLVASPTLVVVGSQLHYVSGSVTNPTGWYMLTVSGATLASDVQFIPGGTISGTNVQLAISELDSETQTALAGKAPSAASTGAGTSFPPSGGISASNVTAAIQELDTETVKLSGGTMTGGLFGTTFAANYHQVGVSATPANNFFFDGSYDNGTMRLARNSGQDIMTVDTAGKADFSIGILGFSYTSNSNGQCLAFPSWAGGVKIQWGNQGGSAGTMTVTFPVTFTTTPIYAVATPEIPSASPGSFTVAQILSNITTISMAVNRKFYNGTVVGDASENVNWIAIGR